ncbi:MAG: OmpH family outer membrane protein [Flavobacterium sp.]|nr:MAG: OmpH family outer membrane protein [Flavobacterium sp.]
MNLFKKLALTAILVLFAAFQGNSQEVAYVNSLVVINSMPETKVAKQQLDQYRQVLNNEYDAKVNAFQTKLAQAQQKAKSGGYTVEQQKEVEATLGKEEQQIRDLETNSVKKINDKENSLYQPIYNKANAAIADVAKASGFKIVLDSSAGIVLYAEASTDITQRVIDKLK